MPSSCDDFIKVAKTFLIAGGFWPFRVTNNPLKAKFYSFYCRFQTITYVGFISSLLLNILFLVTKKADGTRIFAAINVFVVVFESCVKILIFQIRRIPNMFEHTIEHERFLKTSEDQETLSCYIFCAVPFTAIPLLEVYHSKDLPTDYKEKPFMHDLWYPFRRETHMSWVIALNIIMITQGTCFNTATQATFINLMVYASCRFKILHIKLRKFDRIAREEHGGDVVGTVKGLIVEHQELIRFVMSLNERTKYVMLMEFLLNALSLAAGVIQMVVVENAGQLFVFFTVIFMQLFQIFILAWSANEISVQALDVADAIAASNWQSETIETQKLFLMMIMRAQVPIALTAGDFFSMSTGTAVNTVKAAYTYLSVMLQNYDN